MRRRGAYASGVLLALIMLIALMTVSAFADGEVAEVTTASGHVTQYTNLANALSEAEDGSTVRLLQDVVIDPTYAVDQEHTESLLVPAIVIETDITLDLADHTIMWDKEILDDNLNNIWYTLCFLNISGGEVTLTGNGMIDTNAPCNSYGINITESGTVTIESGTYTGATTAIQVSEGVLIIHGGTFRQADYIAAVFPGYAKYVINCIDGNYADGSAEISITGGTLP